MRLKAERRFKLHIIKLHYDSLVRESLQPSGSMVALLWESDCVLEIQSSLKERNCQNIPPAWGSRGESGRLGRGPWGGLEVGRAGWRSVSDKKTLP